MTTTRQTGHDRMSEAAWHALHRSQALINLGLDRRIVWANDAACALFGYPPGALDGMSHAVLCRDAAGRSAADLDVLWAKLLAGRYDRAEYRRFARDGRELWLQATYTPVLDEGGTVASVLKIATDVTARRHRDAEVAGRLAAVERALFAVELSADGTILAANAALCTALGKAEADLIGRPHDTLIVALDSAIDDSTPTARTIGYRGADGRTIVVRVLTTPILDSDGCPVKTLLLGRDVTEFSDLRVALTRAEEAARTKARFLANMSHEVRTPMAGILGFAELLLKADLAPDQHTQARMIHDSGTRMLALLDDVLDVAKLEAGRMTVVTEPVDLTRKLATCTALLRPVAEERGLSLTCEVAPGTPQWIESDPLRLRQILLNLIGNAVKFTDRGEIVVRAASDGAGRLTIAVTDTGIGMSEAQLARVIAPFAQADDSTQRRHGGTGLGLTISSELAQLLGGTLTLTSRPGAGTRADLALPLRTAPAMPAIEPLAEPAEAKPPHAITGLRVLVAEDDPINQALVREQLERLGARAEIAPNGAIAVAMVAEGETQSDPFGIVLMDLHMPVMDGLDAARSLRRAGYGAGRLPIVALTASAWASDRRACLAAGMQAHVAKPVSLEALAAAIGEWADGRQLGPRQDPAQAARLHPALADMFGERRARLLERLAALARHERLDAGAVAGLADDLHNVAGVAGLFGQHTFGELARACEARLRRAAPGDCPELVRAAEQALRAAA